MTSAFASAIGGGLDTIRGAAGVMVEIRRLTKFEPWPLSHYAQATYIDGQRGGPAVRMPESGYGGYFVQPLIPAAFRLWRINANNSETLLAAVPTPASWSNGDLMYLSAVGAALGFYRNGVLLISLADDTWVDGVPGLATTTGNSGTLSAFSAGGVPDGELASDGFDFSGDLDARDDWTKVAGTMTASGAGTVTIAGASRYRWAAAAEITRSADAVAVPAETRFEQPTDFVFVGLLRVRDFLIEASAYGFGAGAVEPEPGDYVRETLADGSVEVFEVMSPGGREPAWRWSDRGRTTYRVHTKRVATEEGSGG